MANGVLSLLKEIFTDKKAELDRDFYNKSEEIEKQLEEENPKFREMTKKLDSKKAMIDKLNEEISKIEETKKRLFPKNWDAKEKAEKMLKEDYLNLRLKATLNGIPKEKVKKMVEDSHNKDYLARAMGA